MIKRALILILVIAVIFVMCPLIFADIDTSLSGHWAEKLIDKDFLNDYISFIKEENDKFTPDENINTERFLVSLYNVISSYDSTLKSDKHADFDTALSYFQNEGIIKKDDIDGDKPISRLEAVKLMMKTLGLFKEIKLPQTNENAFKDLNKMNEEDIAYTLEANRLGIVNGHIDGTFRPDMAVSQVQAILLLQRYKGELQMNKKLIPFVVQKNLNAYSGQKEAVKIEIKGDKVLIMITREFPTSGYSMSIEKILESSSGNYDIYLKINKPDSKQKVLQVITYKSIKVEIDKAILMEPYKFNVLDTLLDQSRGLSKRANASISQFLKKGERF